MADRSTFPALERLKAETEGLDVLVEVAPPLVAAALEYMFDLDYVDRREALLERRDEVRETYQHHRQRIERTYGSDVVRACARREDGDQPRFDLERMETELNDASAAVDTLYDAVNEDYLTRIERRKLAVLETNVREAREYVRNKIAFDRQRERLSAEIEEFDARFEPYAGADRYMISSDQEVLIATSNEIWYGLADMARELVLPVLPGADADWLTERKTRFGELVDYLPDYNDEFVASERERYADLLVTDHGPLNDQQQKAVVRDDRRNLVDASAGTGKTLTLTYRFVYLLEKGVPASDIVAITYTKDAAAEMSARIAEAAGVQADDLNISTIHAFANSIYHEARSGGSGNLGTERERLVDSFHNAASRGHDTERAAVEFPDCYAAFKRGYEEFINAEGDYGEDGYIADNKRFGEDPQEFVRRKLEEFVEEARTFDRSAEEIRQRLDGTDRVRDAFGEAGAALVEAYDRVVEREDAPTDFDDMVYTATEVVESNPERFGDRFAHVLVDEFQDVTDATLGFVESFMGGESETHLFCVGDDWQSIYGFSGSNVRYFTEYEERFDDVTYTQLQVNYRCPPAVVDAGADLMAQSAAPQNEKVVRAFSDLDAKPTLHTMDALYEPRVVEYVADMVESAIAERPLDDVMVLSRNDAKSAYMERLREELERREIPHRRPKFVRDFLPEGYRESVPYPVTFDQQDFATYDVPDGEETPESGPPLVTLQSVHASKGTEAPVVILLHAVDEDEDGIPIKEQADVILDPAREVTAERIPEERRLFYVALTRTEEEFHAVARADEESQYVQDIEQWFQRVAVPTPEELVGTCTQFTPARQERMPVKATLDCGGFEVSLLSWPNQDPPRLEKGVTYRLELDDPNRQIERSKYGVEIRFDRTPIERIGTGKTVATDD
ncbi:UvrD-helicase domain-containing protein [Halobaculum marinum]|uniref:DNA 3'-5' helicase n=1 Tax=Halobaculum marinum TaxID=3031996 RepID=A0ABD5WTI0_9EURY|nr:UvrD-helicase domain-containing protein [Halobaculum sp. DT55]